MPAVARSVYREKKLQPSSCSGHDDDLSLLQIPVPKDGSHQEEEQQEPVGQDERQVLTQVTQLGKAEGCGDALVAAAANQSARLAKR